MTAFVVGNQDQLTLYSPKVPLLDRSAPFIDEIVVTKEGETKPFKGLNPSEVLGPDELHPRVLKVFAKELGPVFEHLY